MLNKDRIILMTKMASYENTEGKQNIEIGKYFRGDYLTIQLLKSFVIATVGFLIVFGLYFLYHFEEFVADIYDIDKLVAFAKNALIYYVVTVVGYEIISYLFFSYRYAKAKKNLKYYYYNLKKLGLMYNRRR